MGEQEHRGTITSSQSTKIKGRFYNLWTCAAFLCLGSLLLISPYMVLGHPLFLGLSLLVLCIVWLLSWWPIQWLSLGRSTFFISLVILIGLFAGGYWLATAQYPRPKPPSQIIPNSPWQMLFATPPNTKPGSVSYLAAIPSQTLPPPSTKRLHPPGSIQSFLDSALAHYTALHQGYSLQAQTIHPELIFDYARIKEMTLRNENMQIMYAMKLLSEQYRQQSYHMSAALKKEVGALNISDSEKDILSMNIDRMLTEPESHLQKIWDLEEKAIDEISQLLNLLNANTDHWRLDHQGDIVFDSPTMLSIFQDHLTTIRQTINQQHKRIQEGISFIQTLYVQSEGVDNAHYHR